MPCRDKLSSPNTYMILRFSATSTDITFTTASKLCAGHRINRAVENKRRKLKRLSLLVNNSYKKSYSKWRGVLVITLSDVGRANRKSTRPSPCGPCHSDKSFRAILKSLCASIVPLVVALSSISLWTLAGPMADLATPCTPGAQFQLRNTRALHTRPLLSSTCATSVREETSSLL